MPDQGFVEEITPIAPAVPIDASGSATAVSLRTFAFQLVIAAGALVSVLGLGDDHAIVLWIRFFNREEAIPIIIALVTVAASAWQILRALAKHAKFQVMSLLLPQRVAISPANPPAPVAKAAEAATLLIVEQDPAHPASVAMAPARAQYPGSGI